VAGVLGSEEPGKGGSRFSRVRVAVVVGSPPSAVAVQEALAGIEGLRLRCACRRPRHDKSRTSASLAKVGRSLRFR